MTQAGTITRVALRNFLTHSDLVVELDKLLFFLHGRNGSGKSSVFQAICFVLGESGHHVRDNTTSAASLVRRAVGETINQAEVTITLSNTGFDAYRPDVFGHSIVISRKITISPHTGKTNTSLSVKTAHGRVPPKEEFGTAATVLHSVCTHFSIFPSNRVQFMRQQDMKTFCESTPVHHYSLFAEAAQLTSQLSNYERLLSFVPTLSKSFKELDEEVSGLQDEETELKKRLKETNDQVLFNVRLRQAQVYEALSAQVEAAQEVTDSSARLDNSRNEVTRHESKLEDALGEARELERQVDEKKLQLTSLDQAHDQLRRPLDSARARVRELSSHIEALRAPVGAAERTLCAKQTELENASAGLRRAQDRLSEARRSTVRDTAGALAPSAELEAACEQATAAAADYAMKSVERAEELRAASFSASTVLDTAKTELQTLDRDRDRAKNDLAAIASRQRSARASEPSFESRCAAIAESCKDLHIGVQRNKDRFHGEIHGPVGAHLSINMGTLRQAFPEPAMRKRALDVIHKIVAMVSRMFLVSSQDLRTVADLDRYLARQTARKGPRPVISTFSQRDFQVKCEPCAAKAFATHLYRLSDFVYSDNVAAHNALLSRCFADKVYFSTSPDTIRLAYDMEAGMHLHDLHSQRLFKKHDGGLTSDSNIVRPLPPFLKMPAEDLANVDEQLKSELEARMTALIASIESARVTFQEAQSNYEGIRREQQKLRDDGARLEKEASDATTRLSIARERYNRALDDDRRHNEQSVKMRLRSAEHEVLKAQGELSAAEEELKRAQEQLTELEEVSAEETRRANLRLESEQELYTQLQDDLNQSAARLQEVRELVSDLSSKKRAKDVEIETLKATIASLGRAVEEFSTAVTAREAELADAQEETTRRHKAARAYVLGGDNAATVTYDDESIDAIFALYGEEDIDVINRVRSKEIDRRDLKKSPSVHMQALMRAVTSHIGASAPRAAYNLAYRAYYLEYIAVMVQGGDSSVLMPREQYGVEQRLCIGKLEELRGRGQGDFDECREALLRVRDVLTKKRACVNDAEDLLRGFTKLGKQQFDMFREVQSNAGTTFASKFKTLSLGDGIRPSCNISVTDISAMPPVSFKEVRYGGYKGPGAAVHGKLEVFVRTHGSRERSRVQTLSGGERATITLALLTTAWGLSSFPFVLIDEWDVFMDASRREIALNLLVRTCVENGVQAVMLTPNRVTFEGVLDDDEVDELTSVFQLRDPRRHD